MRLKKGFTLAEILIVLMVIGAIATMTIPSLIRGVQDAQFKTAYKKAYNTILNVTAMERVNGKLPTTATTDDVLNFFGTLTSYLSVKEYAQPSTDVTTGGTVTYVSAVKYTTGTGDDEVEHTVGDSTSSSPYTFSGSDISPWVITDDNFAYTVVKGGGQDSDGNSISTCSTKAVINGKTTATDAFNASCVAVVVDVNGLNKSPNAMNDQAKTGIDKTASVSELSGDRYYIYVGSDGATVGPRDYTVTGRIISDMD